MLLDDVTKAYIVCYCDPSGSGNSACTKCKEVGIQKNCSFFVKSTVMDSCSNLRYDRYCNCFYASDFVNGKDVHIENIPNLPKKDNQTRMTPKTFIDTPYGLREIKGPPTRREIYREFVSPYPWEMQKVVKKVQGIDRHEKMHEQVLASDQIDDHYADMSEVMGDYEEWQDKKGKTMCKHCNVIFCAEPCPKYLNSDITLGVDTSGSMTPESFQELANMVAEQLTNQTLTWTRPINTFMDMSELRELMDGLCCAYSHKYGLYLDMSDLDIYTIYKRDGYFIDLRSLYKDGIFPMDLNFKMIDGRNQEDVDFLPFLEMVPKMLNSGR